MSFFNLVHFFPKQAGPSRRWLVPLGLFAVLLFPLPTQTLAQGANWGQWVEPAKKSDDGIPRGVAYPGGQQLCEGMKLSGKHAYWRCFPRCNGESGGWCWEGISDAIYTCPAPAKGFRRMEKIRYTNVPCGPKDWQQTKHLAEIYEETWITKITETPPELTNPSPPPTTEAELPPQTGDTPSQWDGGGPPWAPKEAEKTDTGKPDTAKTDTAKTDTGKTDTPKTDTPKTDTDKKVTGGGSGTTTPSGKKANRKEVQKQSKSVARRRTDDQYDDGPGGGLSPEAATAIGIGIGMGLGGGFGGRGHMGGGSPDGRPDGSVRGRSAAQSLREGEVVR